MFHLPTPMLMGAPQGKTYDDFVAHITALATEGTASWTNNVTLSAGGYRTTAGPSLGFAEMRGSIWMSYALAGIPPSRLTQHGMPSEAAFNAQTAAGRQVFFRLTSAGNQSSYASLSRNGYTSQSYSDDPPPAAVYCPELIYWDGAAAWKMNPFAGTGPTPYTW